MRAAAATRAAAALLALAVLAGAAHALPVGLVGPVGPAGLVAPVNNHTMGKWAQGRATFYGRGDGFSVHEGALEGGPRFAPHGLCTLRAPSTRAPRRPH
jgi:hypothetical protein